MGCWFFIFLFKVYFVVCCLFLGVRIWVKVNWDLMVSLSGKLGCKVSKLIKYIWLKIMYNNSIGIYSV